MVLLVTNRVDNVHIAMSSATCNGLAGLTQPQDSADFECTGTCVSKGSSVCL